MSEDSHKSDVAKREEELLTFWRESEIFKKSLEKPSPNGNYVFYDGPPFATGTPHYGHILASTIKDAVPRYHTMNGKHVERRWGWDTHGLPIENKVEQKLGISGKKEIEKMGVENFNKTARAQVLEYVSAWKKTVERMARWVDFDGAYLTMDNDYVESVWWGLSEINKKGLLYEGERVLPYCPRCETPVANSEIAMDNSYKDITDISVTVKFELTDEPGTFLLAWTTTPWTLPGNVAAAVNGELDYVKVERKEEGNGKVSQFIVAKDNAEKVFKDSEYKILETFKGSELVGKTYKPVFDYFKDVNLKNKENIWKVWDADYVTTEQGTGVVHLAPVYGEEDMELAKKNNLPLIHHVNGNGTFTDEVKDFAGQFIKPKDNHQVSDIEIIKNLAHRGFLFSKEKIIHSYPHCFRCETPLFYNALSAWFINIQKVKDRALSLNKNVHWVPGHLKDGRFGKSMEGAPDWNISRNRFWASPLPIWKSEDGEVEVLSSVEDIKDRTKSSNKYFVMRHGEAESNVKGFVSSDNQVKSELTEKGLEDAKKSAQFLKENKPDIIISSPLYRTLSTAQTVAKELGMNPSDVISDERIKEIQTGEFNGNPIENYRSFFSSQKEKFTKTPPGGENLNDLKKRVGDFIYDIDSSYEGKTILIVTHEYVVWLLNAIRDGLDVDQSVAIKEKNEDFVLPGEINEFKFAPVPHNTDYELDLHRPYIDRIVYKKNGKTFKRIPEVVDCWVESGSMPFAAKHYPFENKDWFEENFPAQFVAEYIAQTRTWFYYSHMMSTILFDKAPFENIVTTGNVQGDDGFKMSKSRNNFPDPWLVFDKYGVDAVRYYLLSSPLLKSEDLDFSEKGVDEVYKKIILRLRNVVSFYEMYKTDADVVSSQSENILDQWMIVRTKELIESVTTGMEAYEIDRATKPFLDFIDDLSTWYLRRSRDRFKGDDESDKKNARNTLKYVLNELSKTLAPFMPFLAEDIYLRVGNNKESVHLEDWPKNTDSKGGFISQIFGKGDSGVDHNLLNKMKNVREFVTLALEARDKVNLKVRQPLASLKLKLKEGVLEDDLLELIKDEVNVKEVLFDEKIKEEVELDTELTDELKEEGALRDVIRFVQSMRKDKNMNQVDFVTLSISTDDKGDRMLEKYGEEFRSTTKTKDIVFGENDGLEVKANGSIFKIEIK